MLSIEVIRNARALLERVPLKGAEVPAFNRIMEELAADEFANSLQAASLASERPALSVVESAPPAQAGAS